MRQKWGLWVLEHERELATVQGLQAVLGLIQECGYAFGVFFFSSRRRHTRCLSDWSSDVCSSDLDTARELGAKLSSLKGIVWVGVGLFVFGLGSLVYPPLK